MKNYAPTLLLAAATALMGCGQETSKRTATRTGGGQGGNVSTDSPSTDTDGGGGESGSLKKWLFTLAEAKEIAPLVLPYEASKEDDSPLSEPSLRAQQDFIKDIVDDMMAIPLHDPGRNFSITVSADSDPNASALNQSLVIHKGLITFASNLSLVMVLCHEIAHSSRNHSALAEKQMIEYEAERTSEADALDKKVNAFVKKTWNASTRRLTFTQQDYNNVKPTWDAFWSEYVVKQRKLESEADIVGGQICANAGFTGEEVQKGFSSLFDKFKNLESVKIKPGSYSVEQAELGTFLHQLFGESVHPDDSDRQKQIVRVKELFKAGDDKSIATKWKSDFPSQGLSLIEVENTRSTQRYHHRTIGESVIIKRVERAISPN